MYKELTRYALDKGCTITISEWEPEEDEADLYKSDDYDAIIEEIEAVDECQYFVLDGDQIVAVFAFTTCNDNYEESLIDYTVNDWTTAAEAAGVC